MPNLSYDAQSFLIDARRTWLVSTTLSYTSINPKDWSARIAQARHAGMNCIEVIVPWRVHEPEQGKFHFTGQANLRKFVQLIIAQGMNIILRPGPYVGPQEDLGGLPAYLLAEPDIQLRQANPAFLQACARYFGKMMAQVHDLQITSPRLDNASDNTPDIDPENAPHNAPEDTPGLNAAKPLGPNGIIMVQAEHQWLCHHPEQGKQYLNQIVRYLRENNCQVPISLSNNLWQQVDGVIDTWHASQHLASDLRQLRMIQPDTPRIVSHLAPATNPDTLLAQIASTIAVGAQFNLDPFLEGESPQSSDQPSPCYQSIKRLATLATQFSHVLAHALPASQPAAVTPGSQGVSVLQQQGPQGTLIFVIQPEAETTTTKTVQQPDSLNLLLPDGQTLPVPLGNDSVAWIGCDINLSGIAQLTLTNLRPWAWIAKKMLVLFGPADAQGLVVINGSSLSFIVPAANQPPAIFNHEELTVVVLSEQQIDTAWPVAQGLIVNASSLDQNDQPVPLPNCKTNIKTSSKASSKTNTSRKSQHAAQPALIDLNGNTIQLTGVPPAPSKKTKANTPVLSSFQQLSMPDMLNGKSDSYQAIEHPRSMESLGMDSPYVWYHLKLSAPVAAVPTLASPASGGQLMFHVNNKYTGTLEAQKTGKIKLAKETVILAHNPGRRSAGWRMNEPTGLAGDLFAIKPLKLSKPKIASKVVDSPLTFRAYLQDIRHEHREMAQTLTWSLTLRSKAARIFAWENFPLRSMLLVNDQIAGVYDPALSDHAQQILLEMDDLLRSGKNELTLAILEPLETLKAGDVAPMLKQVKMYEASRVFTEKAEIRYARWELPDAAMFDDQKSAAAKHPSTGTGSNSGPCWYRATFDADPADSTNTLSLELKGIAQGQVYLNHHPIARLAPETGEHDVTLPAHWLHTDMPNELLVFDDQGSKSFTAKLLCR